MVGRGARVLTRIVTALLVGALLTAGSGGSASGQTTRFTDVSPNHVFAAEIAWLADQGISTGYAGPSGPSFQPAAPVLREQMAAFLYRFAGSPAVNGVPTTSPYVDVPTTHVFFKEIVWLQREGITTGYADGTFRPGQPVLREQMAAFINRLAEGPVPPLPAQLPFVDVPVSHVFFSQIQWLSEQGISTGYGTAPNRTFAPSAPVLREQMAAFLFRADGVLQTPDPMEPVVVGVVAPGRTVAVDVGSDPDDAVAVQWLIDGQPVAGATTRSYTVRAADVGHQLAVQVRRTSPDAGEPETSAPVLVEATSTTLRVAGTIDEDTTWGTDGIDTIAVGRDVLVAEDVTLTIAPGTDLVVEIQRAIEVAGSLVALGTAEQPIGARIPFEGDQDGFWRGVRVLPGGSIDASHLSFGSAEIGVAGVFPGPVASFSVQDSLLDDMRDHAIYLADSVTPPVVRNINGSTGLSPVVVRSSNLDPSLIRVNRVSTSRDPILIGGTVTTSGSFENGVVGLGVGPASGDLTVAAGATLTMPAGQYWVNLGQSIVVEGKLVATGASGLPVTLSSVLDRNGHPVRPTDSDWGGVVVRDGGELDLTRTVIRWASTGITGDDAGRISVVDSLIRTAHQAVELRDGSPLDGPWPEHTFVRTSFEQITDTAITVERARLLTSEVHFEVVPSLLEADHASVVLAGTAAQVRLPVWVRAVGTDPARHLVDVTRLEQSNDVPMLPEKACGFVTTGAGPAPAC
ncbi:S-layer homology domain-containing protein [Aeromicrobium alkaliterrae]|uniref:SLH domain-containing protein n=1 Tax=Aeromicrobium alkaliterrae TaxID=302168 RepID=A0ABN2K6F8_9ACTN